jgi:hypothetical protein
MAAFHEKRELAIKKAEPLLTLPHAFSFNLNFKKISLSI